MLLCAYCGKSADSEGHERKQIGGDGPFANLTLQSCPAVPKYPGYAITPRVERPVVFDVNCPFDAEVEYGGVLVVGDQSRATHEAVCVNVGPHGQVLSVTTKPIEQPRAEPRPFKFTAVSVVHCGTCHGTHTVGDGEPPLLKQCPGGQFSIPAKPVHYTPPPRAEPERMEVKYDSEPPTATVQIGEPPTATEWSREYLGQLVPVDEKLYKSNAQINYEMRADVPRNVGDRFNCFDLQRRAAEPAWPKPWRARIRPQSKGRERYRLTAFGDTAAEAIAKLDDMVIEQDIKQSRGDL